MSALKTVLFYSDEPYFGGSEKWLKNLLNDEEFRAGYDLVLSYRYSERYDDGARTSVKSGVKFYPIRLADGNFMAGTKNIFARFLIRLPLRILKEIYFFFILDLIRIFAVIRKIRPDIIHINSGGFPTDASCPAAAVASGIAGIKKVFFNVNSMAADYTPHKKRIEMFFDRLVEGSVATFITASEYARDRLSRVRNIDAGKVINIYTPVEKDIAIDEGREEVRLHLQLGSGDILIGCIAMLDQYKDHMSLVEAVILLKGTDPLLYEKIKVIIAGDGPEENSLRKRMNRGDVGEKVLFAGFRKDIFNLINACDIVVLPTKWEDFPSVVLEAMYFYKPVIASRVGGVPEQIEDGVSGLLVDPGSPLELKDAILRLAVDKDLRNRMGLRAKEKLERDFSYSDFLKKYKALYR